MAGLLPFVGFSHCLCQASAFCFPLSRPHGKQTPRGRLLEDLVSGLFAQVKPQYTDWEKVHGKKLPPHQVRWSTQDLDTITCTDPWPNAPGGDGCRKLLHRPPHLWHRGESPLPYACPLCMSLMHVPYACPWCMSLFSFCVLTLLSNLKCILSLFYGAFFLESATPQLRLPSRSSDQCRHRRRSVARGRLDHTVVGRKAAGTCVPGAVLRQCQRALLHDWRWIYSGRPLPHPRFLQVSRRLRLSVPRSRALPRLRLYLWLLSCKGGRPVRSTT